MTIGIEQIISYISTTKDIVSIIEKLLNEQKSMIRQVADAQRSAALGAIRAAREGKQHISVAIGHLRVVYNLLHIEANKPPTLWERLNETQGGSERLYRVAEIAEEATEVAVLICKKHWELGERSNARDWAQNAVDSFKLFEEYDERQPTFVYKPPGYVEEIEGLREEKRRKVAGKWLKLKEALSEQLTYQEGENNPKKSGEIGRRKVMSKRVRKLERLRAENERELQRQKAENKRKLVKTTAEQERKTLDLKNTHRKNEHNRAIKRKQKDHELWEAKKAFLSELVKTQMTFQLEYTKKVLELIAVHKPLLESLGQDPIQFVQDLVTSQRSIAFLEMNERYLLEGSDPENDSAQ
jgi:hypothetical protein